MVQLVAACAWQCEVCETTNCEIAEEHYTLIDEEGDPVIEELPENADAHFETLDDEGGVSRYLVMRVLVGPPFVKCHACEHVFPALLPEMADDEDGDDTIKE